MNIGLPKKVLSIVCLLLFFITYTFSQTNQLRFRKLATKGVLSDGEITAIQQDKKGFIWIATNSGLFRYDGYLIETFYNNTERNKSVYLNRISDMVITENNLIWMATEGGLTLFDPLTESFKKIETTKNKDVDFLNNSLTKILIVKSKIYVCKTNNMHVYAINQNNTLTSIPFVSKSISWPVFDIKADDKERVWITHKSGITILSDKWQERKFSTDSSTGIPTALYTNESNVIYISFEKGLYIFNAAILEKITLPNKIPIILNDKNLQKVASFSFGVLNNRNAFNLKKSPDNSFWLSSTFGVKKINPKTGEVFSYNANQYNTSSISDNYITSLFIDKSACLWVGTFGVGVNIADLMQKPFQLIQKTSNIPNTLSSNFIRSVLEDEKGNLWIGTHYGGLNYYDVTNKTFTKIDPSNSSLPSYNVRSLAKDKNGRLWIANEASISIRNTNGAIENIKPGVVSNVAYANYTAVAIDMFNQAWTGSWDKGLSKIVYKNSNNYTVQNLTPNGEIKGFLSNRISFIYADSTRPEVLIGTDHGLNHVFLNQDGSIKKVTSYEANGTNGLSSTFVRQVLRQNDSTIWVGTLGGGLNKITLQRNGNYSVQNIKDNNNKTFRDIECMLLDDSGNLWLAGNVLARYNPKKNEFIYFDVNDGLQDNSFLRGGATKGKSGNYYFGGTNGITFFNPSNIFFRQDLPQVAFSGLVVNGVTVNINEAQNDFRESIGYSSELRLNESQNNFSVQFSAMHYANPERCRFKYKLEGYDNTWKYTDALNRFASYSNLNFGTYTLKVVASNNDGLWSNNQTELIIHVIPPWWKSTAAKVVYIILLLAIIYALWKSQREWFHLKRRLHFKELEEKKQEELHQMKLQFFTNISHEFRTPLTLILGPTEKMLYHEDVKKEHKSYLNVIYSNAKRLLNLVNELMDFRQVESGNLQLKVSEGNLGELVSLIASEFKEMATQRNIQFVINTNQQLTNGYFDPNFVEKIVVNLLSNAFKYSENNSNIEIEILTSLTNFKPKFLNHVHIKSKIPTNEFTWIRVSDTGIGIEDNAIMNVFNRYFRVDTLGKESHLGSGVGLALVKSLVEQHYGELMLYSERNAGSEFLVGLPTSKLVYSDAELTNTKNHKIDFENLQYLIEKEETNLNNSLSQVSATSTIESSVRSKRILIVEDNEEMRNFLVGFLKDEYEIIEAENGKKGYEKAIEQMPDMIISDLMMPEIGGNEFCKLVREDVNISHTPFILITAKASLESQIESTETGADIYFPKPFSLQLLQTTIRKLFESRDKLKEKYNKDVFAETREVVTNQKDKDFLDTLIAIIEENMESEELDVEMICRKIGMSRTKLYGKVKGITGQPIGEFTRLLRLKKAAKIMATEDIPITEVMFRVGIQSQSYFTKQFKKEFGKTPLAFISELDKGSLKKNN